MSRLRTSAWALLLTVCTAGPAAAQVTVRIDQAPQQVAPGATYEVAWTVFSADPVDLTAVVWGTQPGNWDQIGQRLSGAPGSFRTQLTAPATPGAIHWAVYVRAGLERGVSAEHVIQVTPPPPPGPRQVEVRRQENPPLAIPDEDSTGASSNLTVSDSGRIVDLEVDVAITHTYRGDLTLELSSPQGTTITLYDPDNGDGDDDVRGTFPRDLRPEQPLSRFNGEEVQGTWTLRVRDGAGQDEGTIDAWTLRATVQSGGGGGSGFGLDHRVPVQGLTFPLSGANPPSSLTPVRAFPSLRFDSPVFLTHAGDGSNRLFVIEQAGRIMVFPNDDAVAQASVFLDIRPRVSSGGEMGLLGLAFAPDYAQSGRFYVYYTAGSPRRSVIARYRVSADPNVADASSEQVLLTVNQPYSNHNAGMLAFGPDGMLYAGLGDGGSGGDPHGNGQDLNTLLAKILRLDVSGAGLQIPADNPFVGQSGVRGEIWAYGMRNPWRFSFDRATGDLWVGDVGQDEREEVDLIERGGNYGWNIREGTQSYGFGHASNLREPVLDYDHSEGRTVIGGYVYRGNRMPSMRGIYVYGDYASDSMWGIRYDGNHVTWQRRLATLSSVVSFGEDEPGELYAVSYDGRLFRFQPNGGGGGGGTFPTRLSQTGLFQDLASLTPNPGLIEYTVSSPLWSDGARKRRWIALPGNQRIRFNATGAWSFPVGTVLVKHFELDTDLSNPGSRIRRLETRVLIHEQSGWAGYTYQWNDQGTDAELLSGGDQESYQITDPSAPGGVRTQTWSYPSRADCRTCHNAAAGRVLGPRTGQLNVDFAYPGMQDNQLRAWNHIGLFDHDIGDPAQYTVYPNPFTSSASLEERARSYLTTNCGLCHLPGGPTPFSYDFRYEADRTQLGVIDAHPQAGDLGLTDPRVIAPGEKERSVLWERMRSLNGNRMPLIGSRELDPAGIDLIGRWIDQGAN